MRHTFAESDASREHAMDGQTRIFGPELGDGIRLSDEVETNEAKGAAFGKFWNAASLQGLRPVLLGIHDPTELTKRVESRNTHASIYVKVPMISDLSELTQTKR